MSGTTDDNQIAITDSQLVEDVDTLVHHASLGDRHAIGAIAIAYGPDAARPCAHRPRRREAQGRTWTSCRTSSPA